MREQQITVFRAFQPSLFLCTRELVSEARRKWWFILGISENTRTRPIVETQLLVVAPQQDHGSQTVSTFDRSDNDFDRYVLFFILFPPSLLFFLFTVNAKTKTSHTNFLCNHLRKYLEISVDMYLKAKKFQSHFSIAMVNKWNKIEAETLCGWLQKHILKIVSMVQSRKLAC